jgi:glutathione S-transferase
MRLHDEPLSAEGYAVRLLLSMLGCPCEIVAVDSYPGREHRQPGFIDPLGRLPVLEDGSVQLAGPQSILVYLAARYDASGQWYPQTPEAQGRVMQWLGFASDELRHALAARAHDMLAETLIDIESARAQAHRALAALDEHLSAQSFDGNDWLTGKAPSIADLACFPGVALSTDGGITREAYHQVNRWMYRVRRLPGFITMPGVLAH